MGHFWQKYNKRQDEEIMYVCRQLKLTMPPAQVTSHANKSPLSLCSNESRSTFWYWVSLQHVLINSTSLVYTASGMVYYLNTDVAVRLCSWRWRFLEYPDDLCILEPELTQEWELEVPWTHKKQGKQNGDAKSWNASCLLLESKPLQTKLLAHELSCRFKPLTAPLFGKKTVLEIFIPLYIPSPKQSYLAFETKLY